MADVRFEVSRSLVQRGSSLVTSAAVAEGFLVPAEAESLSTADL